MSYEEIIHVIQALAAGNGFYGRLLSRINVMEELEQRELARELERQQFKDPVDVVMFFEQ